MPSLPRPGRALAVALALIPLLVLSQGTASAATELNAKQESHLLATMSESPAKSLKYLPGMTDESISKVMAFREGGKKFTSVKQFKEVSGITETQWDQLAKRYSGVLADRRQPSQAPAAGRAEAGQKGAVASGGKSLAARMEARAGGPKGPKDARSTGPAPPTGGGLDLEVQGNYYSILPGYDLSDLTEDQRKAFLDTINTQMCTCGCKGETLGYCLVNDPGCVVVKARVRKIYKDITGKDAPVEAQQQKKTP